MDTNKKEIIFVLGSTRSGTSLTMQVLQGLGMTLSKKLLPINIHNPYGNLEASEIVTMIDFFRQYLGMRIHTLPPTGFMETPDVKPVMEQLRKHIYKNMHASRTIWGFKEPRSPELLPLWLQIFDDLNISVKFVLSVRNPSHVISSMKKAHNIPFSAGKLMWLLKNLSVLKYTNANVFIIHYEDWFKNPDEIAEKLGIFTGLNIFYPKQKMPFITNLIDDKLNRSEKRPAPVDNPLITSLYDVLSDCRFTTFDKEKLMKTVAEVDTTVEMFRIWSDSYITCAKGLELLSKNSKVK